MSGTATELRVRAVLAEEIGCAPEAIDAGRPLAQLGLDSLTIVRISGRLEEEFGRPLPATLLWDRQTLAAVVDYVRQAPVRRAPAPRTDDDTDIAAWPEYRDFRRRLDGLGAANPYFRERDGGAGVRRVVAGTPCVSFSTYDYLGLAGDPRVQAAATAAVERYGTSSSASRVAGGDLPVHRALEEALADLPGTEAALAFVSGHATGVSVLGHLFGPGDLILHDEQIHNCALQGARLSGAHAVAFAHGDVEAAAAVLRQRRAEHRRAVVVVEGVYSTGGDVADVPAFVALRREHRAWLMVDEAHSIGVLGATGGGVREHFSLDPSDADIWMGTLSKALASCGGYVAGSRALVEYLRYTCPGFVFSAGMPPATAAAALAALEVLRAEPHRPARVRALAARFAEAAERRGLPTGTARGSAIVPLVVGDSARCLDLSARLLGRGIDVPPLVAPAVPEGGARLRFFLSSAHTEEDVDRAVDAVAGLLAEG